MGRIQSNIGLITGIPIMDTVNALMALSAKPRDVLFERTSALQNEQVAVTGLAALLAAVRYITVSVGKEDLYDQREVISSDPDTLSATITGKPPLGTYQFTPLRMVQSQQWLGSGFESDTDPLGGGAFSFRFGDDVQRAANLELFGSGQGVVRGRILITDRSGARAEIDLSTVQTVDDVLEAINGNSAINVTAVARGNGFRLIDHTDQSVSNLKVQDIGGGSTAASLGLGGIDVADDVADGRDMLRLYDGLDLDVLNDGNGVRIHTGLPDINWTLRDGTSSSDEGYEAIDFSPILANSSFVDEDKTLGDVLEAINAAAPGKLRAQIAPDGRRLIITDLTEGDGQFELSSASEVPLLEDLGLDGSGAVDGVITGRRILGGAKTVLLSSLNGGNGFGGLGAVELSDRSGASDTVDLSRAETLEEAVELLNAADVGILAQVNRARNGIELADTTGAHAANLIVANADTTQTADKLGLAVDRDVTVINSGDLHLQVVALNTKLADLNGGDGVGGGSFHIIDSSGKEETLDLRNTDVETVGDLIKEINRLGLSVYAEINETGDGIRIVDTGGGSATLQVKAGRATTAADLHLLGEAKDVEIDGELAQVIDGSSTHVIELDAAITEATSLDSFNGGTGIARGTLQIVDSKGEIDTLDLSLGDPQTVGDVIDMINELSVNVRAEINQSKNGIYITDLAYGDEDLLILEGNQSTASDLHLLGDVEKVDIGGKSTQVIDGTADGVWSLADLSRKINELDAGVTAMTFLDGSSRPYRLSLTSDRPGRAGRLMIDTSKVDFSMTKTARGRDALLVFGDAEMAASSVLVSSSTNTFRGVLPDVTLQIEQASTEPVKVTVKRTTLDLVANVKTLVGNYNNFRTKLTELTAYNTETETGSVLTGDTAALRLDIELAALLSKPFYGVGPIQSLAEVGVNFKSDGTLEFDESRLTSKFAEDPQAVEQFFTDGEAGLSEKFGNLIDQLSEEGNSLLGHRLKGLRDKIVRNQQRITFMEERLTVERERLLLDFYNLELTIGRMQADLAALSSIQALSPVTSVRGVF